MKELVVVGVLYFDFGEVVIVVLVLVDSFLFDVDGIWSVVFLWFVNYKWLKEIVIVDGLLCNMMGKV